MPQEGHSQSQSLRNRKPARMHSNFNVDDRSTLSWSRPQNSNKCNVSGCHKLDFLPFYPQQSIVFLEGAFHSFSSLPLNLDFLKSQLHQGEEREGGGAGEGGSDTSWRRTKTPSTAALPTFFLVRAASRSTNKSVGAKFQIT
jgi:hypothetical protein